MMRWDGASGIFGAPSGCQRRVCVVVWGWPGCKRTARDCHGEIKLLFAWRSGVFGSKQRYWPGPDAPEDAVLSAVGRGILHSILGPRLKFSVTHPHRHA